MSTIKQQEKRGPGRPGLYEDAAARQRAYRERRKLAGLPADSRQDLIPSLRDEIDSLQAKLAEAEHKAALTQSKPDDQTVHELEFKVSDLEREQQHWKFKKSARLRDLLNGRVAMRGRDLTAVFLVDYAGKPIAQGYEFERATKAALEFGRKAASASSAIAEIVGILDRKGQINADETAILEAARKILGELHITSTNIKESARADSKRVKQEEAAREKAATAAVAVTFPAIDADAMLLIRFLDKRHNYNAGALQKMRPETVGAWDLNYHMEQLAGDVRGALRSRVERAVKAGEPAEAAALALKASFEAERTVIEAEIKPILDNLRSCQVAAKLNETNKIS